MNNEHVVFHWIRLHTHFQSNTKIKDHLRKVFACSKDRSGFTCAGGLQINRIGTNA